ncbi:MAG TPA: SDR family NAD(P)-dependent oxidoreductase [Steroidobacteraceae bacterium]|jgi:NAD(P)-dependent dehydrogenase (short-subunit alcohol dehydrogenase family)|nr:SDR family NAD(P)-dependent oxidoreductase [Steroidobacteraceae bacterium]
MNLDQVKAVITGGASGLGQATAARLAAAGAAVALLDVQDEAGRKAAGAIGAQASYHRCDVTDESAVDAAVRAAAERMGGLNVAVSCAGVATPGKLLGKDGPLASSAFQRVMDINVLGTFLLDRAAAAIMQGNAPDADGERGLLIHTASVAAFEGQIGQVAYATSKAAVAGMVLPLARELARFGIRVVGIAPGIFGTPMMSGLPQEAQDSLGKQVPFPPRLGRPDEYAELVAAIVTNHMLNGDTIRLDGAIRMAPR